MWMMKPGRPDEERVPGPRPDVPAAFYEAFGEQPVGLARCACGDLLTIADYQGKCRQCRLEGYGKA